jgi:hypothetical protein
MKTLLLAVTFVSCVLVGGAAVAKPPAGQGKICKSGDKCEAPLQCHKGTCQLVCKDNAACGENQRCIADGDKKICRPIDDTNL